MLPAGRKALEKPVSASNSTLAVMPPNSGENIEPERSVRTLGIGSGVMVTPGNSVGSQKDSLMTMMTSGFSAGTETVTSGLSIAAIDLSE